MSSLSISPTPAANITIIIIVIAAILSFVFASMVSKYHSIAHQMQTSITMRFIKYTKQWTSPAVYMHIKHIQMQRMVIVSSPSTLRLFFILDVNMCDYAGHTVPDRYTKKYYLKLATPTGNIKKRPLGIGGFVCTFCAYIYARNEE